MENYLVVPGLDQEDIGTLLNVRSLAQYTEMVGRILSGHCPFCELDEKINRVIVEIGGWRIWENPFPLKHTSDHFVLAPRRHVTHIADLGNDDWRSIQAIVSGTTQRLSGGALVFRFGDPRKNAGSVRHLHANVIVPDGTGRVQATLAKEPGEISEKRAILVVFEKLRTGTELSQLSKEELALVRDRI
jgi:diadenosine tetraphosphate (Ap4A) HIT family hydrolase